jgi:hypothetical protein
MKLPPGEEELRQQLNLETGKIAWEELQRHYARGVIIKVSTEMDLVDVAVKFVQDNKPAIEDWLTNGSIARATDQDATQWSEAQTVFWAVVAAPWVLVQELNESH